MGAQDFKNDVVSGATKLWMFLRDNNMVPIVLGVAVFLFVL